VDCIHKGGLEKKGGGQGIVGGWLTQAILTQMIGPCIGRKGPATRRAQGRVNPFKGTKAASAYVEPFTLDDDRVIPQKLFAK